MKDKFIHRKRKLLWMFCLSTICLAIVAVNAPPSTSAIWTTVYVDPPLVEDAGLGQNFTININVQNVTNLGAWYTGIKWDPNVLNCTSFQEGPFLKQGGNTLPWPGTINNTAGNFSQAWGYALIPPYTPVNGSGTLANATFTVIGTGYISLFIESMELYEYPNPLLIPHNLVHGQFLLLPPIARFTPSPVPTNLSETTTFDASASDPRGGNITDYTWDFGDGNVTSSGTNPVITHKYTYLGNVTVTLNVTDSTDLWDTFEFEVQVIPEFPTAVIPFMLLLITLAAAILTKKVRAINRTGSIAE